MLRKEFLAIALVLAVLLMQLPAFMPAVPTLQTASAETMQTETLTVEETAEVNQTVEICVEVHGKIVVEKVNTGNQQGQIVKSKIIEVENKNVNVTIVITVVKPNKTG